VDGNVRQAMSNPDNAVSEAERSARSRVIQCDLQPFDALWSGADRTGDILAWTCRAAQMGSL
jgi:hypothetical protein